MAASLPIACLILFLSYAAATRLGLNAIKCYSFEATAFFILDPTNPGQNTFAVGPNESTLPPYRNGAGFTFSDSVNSTRNTKAVYRGVFFITSNVTLSHLMGELEFLMPGSPFAPGAILIWEGKVDFLAGLGTYAVAGGRGVLEGATGSVTETRLTQALSGESWRLHVNFCVPKKPVGVIRQQI